MLVVVAVEPGLLEKVVNILGVVRVTLEGQNHHSPYLALNPSQSLVTRRVRLKFCGYFPYNEGQCTSKCVRKASRVLGKSVIESIHQKFTNNSVHILPEQIHRLAFEPVLIIPETYPELPCKRVRKHQHGTVTLAGTSGQRVKLDIREVRMFIDAIQIPEEGNAEKRDRGRATSWCGLVRRRRGRDPHASLLFVVFFCPHACLLPTLDCHLPNAQNKHPTVGDLGALLLGLASTEPERLRHFTRRRDEVRQDDVEVTHGKVPI